MRKLLVIIGLSIILWPCLTTTLEGYEFLRELVEPDWSADSWPDYHLSDLVTIPSWLNRADKSAASQKTITWALCTSMDTDGNSVGDAPLSDAQMKLTLAPADGATYSSIIATIKKAMVSTNATKRWNDISGTSKISFETIGADGNFQATCRCTDESVLGPFCSPDSIGTSKDLYFIFNDPLWNDSNDHRLDTVLAVTDLHRDVVDGRMQITRALITVNPAPIGTTNYPVFSLDDDQGATNSELRFPIVSLQGVLTHELGHVLGIAHSPVNDDNSANDPAINTMATLYPIISNFKESTEIESLELDDQVPFKILYDPLAFSNEGTLSGVVKKLDGSYVRGAVVCLFRKDAERKTDLCAFSGVTGSLQTNDGTYTIRGIPLDTNYALFVQPLSDDPNSDQISGGTYNTLLGFSDYTLPTFYREAPNDTAFPNVRTNRSILDADLNSAPNYQFTAANPSQVANFYISTSGAAPNDDEGLVIETLASSNTTIEPQDFTLTLRNPAGLYMVDPTSFHISLNKPKATAASDLSANYSPFDEKKSSAEFIIPASNFEKEGDYTVSFSVSSSYPGTYDGIDFSQEFRVEKLRYEGGCAISATENSLILIWILIPLIALYRRRKGSV